MASEFIWRGQEEARQAIARMQVEAAAAENASRERIAKEQTTQQRYATQSQISEREKDRAVRSDDIKLRREYDIANAKLDADTTRDAATKARAKLQFDSVMDSLKNSARNGDPHTARELEALLAQGPDLTEDQKKAAKVLREDAVKAQKSLFDVGDQAAKSYRAELKGKAPNDPALPDIYKRMDSNGDVIFDRASGQVKSAYRMPREDFSPGAGRPVGPPTQSSILGGPRPAGGIPTIGQLQTSIGRPAGQAFAEAANTPPPAPLPFAPTPEASSFFPLAAQQQMAALLEQDAAARARVPRVSDFAAPPMAGPPAFALPPAYGLPGEPYGPPNRVWQPRVADLQGLRQEYAPVDDYYYQ